MSASVNKVFLVGRLGKDPEVRNVGDTQVANFSVATDESYTKDGEKHKKTEWHNIVVWGKVVNSFVAPYLHKGDLVHIEGKLQTRTWEKDGEKKYTTEINVLDIKGLVIQRADEQPAARSNNTSTNNSKPATRSGYRGTSQAAAPEVSDEDIPF